MSTKVFKPWSYISLLDFADWLKMKPELVNAQGATAAQLVVQDLTFKSKLLLGAEGNALSVQYIAGGTAGSEEVTFENDLLKVKIADTVSTADQIKAAVEAHFNANRYFQVLVSGTGTNAQTVAAAAPLAAGANATGYDARLYRSVIDIINGACDKVEAIIKGPVLTREFTEEHDGSDANVIKPHHWPVRKITGLKIDYNRAFGATSDLQPGQYFIRGGADVKQVKSSSPEIAIIGNDVVLRDDNENFILGRIFSGSVLGSIQMKYKAGWGETVDDLPGDILLATRQLAEFWYMQRENRDIGVQSKGVKGESYTRLKDGIPEQIYEMLEQYEDVSLGTRPVPQRNYFRT